MSFPRSCFATRSAVLCNRTIAMGKSSSRVDETCDDGILVVTAS